MKGFSLIFSDLISVALVAYVWARMYTHSALEPRAVRLFRNIGITLLATLAVDHVWQYFFNISDGSAASRQLLNTISSLEFLCVPSTLFFLLLYRRKKWDAADKFALAADIALFALGILNIRMPVYADMDKELYYVNAAGAVWIYLGVLVLFGFILIHDFLRTFNMDFEDQVLAGFVLLIAALGGGGCYYNGDVVAVWECLSIVYLLLYLALERLFDKTDQVTGMPNRNAFTLAYFRETRHPAPVLVSVDVNHLKYFNDHFGHKTGDQYLRAFAQTAQKRLDVLGRFYRVGGDEFCLVSNSEPARVAAAFDDLAHMAQCDPAFGDFPMDFAYGMAVRQPGETNGALYTRADAAMYANKREVESADRASRDKTSSMRYNTDK